MGLVQSALRTPASAPTQAALTALLLGPRPCEVRAFVRAIQRGDLGEVQRLDYADPRLLRAASCDADGYTPLMHAIIARQPGVATWVVAHSGGLDLDAVDAHGHTALHWACHKAQLGTVEELLVAGADPAARDWSGRTPLMTAAEHEDPWTRRYLLRLLVDLPAVRASVDAVRFGEEGHTALSRAAQSQDAGAVRLLLLRAGADPTIPEGFYNPLNRAAARNRTGDTTVTDLLQQAIAEPDRAHSLRRARAVVEAARDARRGGGRGRTRAERVHEAAATAPECLKRRVEQEEPLPSVVVVVTVGKGRGDGDEQQSEELGACLRFVLGLEGHGGEGGAGGVMRTQGLLYGLFDELVGGMLLPAWAARRGL